MVEDTGFQSGHTSKALGNEVGSAGWRHILDTVIAESCSLAIIDKVIQRME